MVLAGPFIVAPRPLVTAPVRDETEAAAPADATDEEPIEPAQEEPTEPLPDEEREWLRERCRVWAGKLDQRLALLEKGEALPARTAADATIEQLIAALEKKAKT